MGTTLPQSRIALSAKNRQGKALNRQENDPWPQTVKQTHSIIEDREISFLGGFWHSWMISLEADRQGNYD
jgi:hypothetical protein